VIRLGWKYGSFGMLLRTLRTRLFGTSDHERWKDLCNHDVDWDTRTRAIAALVPPGSHVIEFGAGRRQLQRWLPGDCFYVPSDIVDRGAGTLLCDLNRRPLPTLGRQAPLQIAVFSGVIEYVVDLPGVLAWLAPQVDRVIASYNCAPSSRTAARRLRVTAARLSAGWVNDFTQIEIIARFSDAGFKLVTTYAVSGTQAEHIYVFSRGS
jgi:hypothetical protein